MHLACKRLVALNQELANISKWLNIKKTMYMIFTHQKTRPTDVKIEIDDEIISETKSIKFLGVHIDNKLNWKCILIMSQGKLQGELEYL